MRPIAGEERLSRRALLAHVVALGAWPVVTPSARARADVAGAPAHALEAGPGGVDALVAHAFEMRARALERGDQPYGAVVARGDEVVGFGPSEVIASGDPTAHAEMVAIRDAAHRLGTRDLSGCVLYGTSRACPMCESAAYWAGVSRLRHGPGGVDDGAPRLLRC